VKTLFEEGVDSDVTIHALGRNWPLHKLYLSQVCCYMSAVLQLVQENKSADKKSGAVSAREQ
jgi:hypothetical protein